MGYVQMKRGYKGLLDNKIYIMGDKNLILEDVRGVGFQVPKKLDSRAKGSYFSLSLLIH